MTRGTPRVAGVFAKVGGIVARFLDPVASLVDAFVAYLCGTDVGMVRRAFAIEFFVTCLVMITMATIEGGVIAVFAKQSFASSVPESQLNVIVGLLGAMGELANILSFFWSSVSHGRPKAKLLSVMLSFMVLGVGVIALVPRSGLGALLVLVGLVLASRVCWSGFVTLRPTLWRENYPPSVRTRVVGILSSVQVLCVATIGPALAATLDSNPGAYRVFLPIAALFGACGAILATRMKMRHEARIVREELEASDAGTGTSTKTMKPWHGPLVMFRVLRQDPWYAQFMLWMFVLGFGNLTITPTLVISLKEEFNFGHLQSVLVTSTVPSVFTLLAIPFWRRLLDSGHVVKFRSIHSWVFVAAGICYCLGAWIDSTLWYFAGAALMGVGYGGGSLAWNIGHVDFARPSETSRYMATHVTLNGIRGLLAPIAVTTMYELLKKKGLDAHLWVQLSSLIISTAGAAGFVHLRWRMGKLTEKSRR
ncbi:MAG: MFS transporter [Phycisphaerales bacterium]